MIFIITDNTEDGTVSMVRAISQNDVEHWLKHYQTGRVLGSFEENDVDALIKSPHNIILL